MKTELLLESHALLAEGPTWVPGESGSGGRLYWLDIEGLSLNRFDPVGRLNERFELSSQVGCFAFCENGNLLLAAQTGVEEVQLKNGNVHVLRTLAHPEADKPGNRYNDGKCSPEGRFWFGSLSMERKTGQGALYVLDEQGCRPVLTGATNSNGLGWSPDGATFYWIDTPTRRIEAFDYCRITGALGRRRTVVAFPEETGNDVPFGRPDGMTVDATGMIWVAHWAGWRISCWNPSTGEILCEVRLPVSRVSSLTFGGDRLDTLFITTASKGMTREEREAEPLAGCIFSVKPWRNDGSGSKEMIGLPGSKFAESNDRSRRVQR